MSLVSDYVDSDSNDKSEGPDKNSDLDDGNEVFKSNDESQSDIKNSEKDLKRDGRDGKRLDDRDRKRDDERDRRRSDDRERKDYDRDRRRESDRRRDDKGRRKEDERDRRRDDDRDRRKDDDKRKYRRNSDRGSRSYNRDYRRNDDDRHSRGLNHRRNRDRSYRGHHGGGNRNNRAADEEYLEYRRKKFGDNLNWGKVSEESLKDVKTDSTLPSAFDGTIAKQLAAQREKRKLLWNSSKGEASTTKTVWGTGALKDDNTGEQTAKFLKLMGVKDVTAENVQNYQADESVLRSSNAVEAMEQEYEKSRYLQHINKGIGLGLVQFTSSSQPKPS